MPVKTKFSVKIVFYFIVLIQILAASSAATKSEIKQRITGGYRPATHGLAKHMVSIRMLNPQTGIITHNCGGSIVKPHVILTAAHCVTSSGPSDCYPADKFEIAAGSPIRINNADTKIFKVKRVVAHPKYDTMIHKHDLGLLYLTQDIVEDGKTAQRIALVKAKPTEGAICTAAGWGRMFNNGPLALEVTYVDLKIFAQKWCYKHFNGIYGEKIICAKGKDETYSEMGICQGDSGGPLICGGALAGIASLGKTECGASGYVDVYTNVYYFTDWIENRAIDIRPSFQLAVLIVFVWYYF